MLLILLRLQLRLNGDDPMTIEVGSTFTGPGTSVSDVGDDEVVVVSTGTVDADTVGSTQSLILLRIVQETHLLRQGCKCC